MSPTNKKLFRRDTHISSLRKQGSLTGMHVTLHVSPTYEPYIWALHMSRTYCSCPTHESYKHSTLYTWTLPTPHAQHMSPTNIGLFAGIHTGSTYHPYTNRALSQGCTSYYIWALQTSRSPQGYTQVVHRDARHITYEPYKHDALWERTLLKTGLSLRAPACLQQFF